MFNSINSISPITQADVAYRADRARRDFAGSRRRRSLLPFYGDHSTAAKRAE